MMRPQGAEAVLYRTAEMKKSTRRNAKQGLATRLKLPFVTLRRKNTSEPAG